VDLVEMKAILWHDETMGAKYDVEEIPAALKEKAEAMRVELIEAVADSDDEVMHKYLEGEEISIEELKRAIRKATIAMHVFPGAVRFELQEQGRADAARRSGRLSAQPARRSSD
jgi:elongation factor G